MNGKTGEMNRIFVTGPQLILQQFKHKVSQILRILVSSFFQMKTKERKNPRGEHNFYSAPAQ